MELWMKEGGESFGTYPTLSLRVGVIDFHVELV